ncbi:succinyl-CoA synthetase-like protein [Hortaea werneckii]|nr:succinyl-CoA synthetase-like protein [Hortaea werneckii]
MHFTLESRLNAQSGRRVCLLLQLRAGRNSKGGYDNLRMTGDKDLRRLPLSKPIEHMQLDAAPPAARAQVSGLMQVLAKMYKETEAVTLSGSVSVDEKGHLRLHQPSIIAQFDDAAFKSEVPEEVEAEKDGIVFVKLDDPEANIGTLVNGAGLAMNTVDALRLHGGKATSETVKKSFELILRDPRVQVIFGNIFGGLTDGGMIAEGVLLAFKEVDMKGKPVVVRIRGTNEETGQRIIADSGLALDAFDGFAEAAKRVVEIANSSKDPESLGWPWSYAIY